MKTSIEQVAEFHEVFNHPIASHPTIPPMETIMFRINFIREELAELEKAALEGDLVEVADGLGDIQYVLDGFYLNAGLHSIKDAISSEIHRSNMSKACRDEQHALETIKSLKDVGVECYYEQVGSYCIVKRTSDGKVMKSLGYSSPALASIISQLANGDTI